MAQYDEEAWRRVGRYLRYRRAQLDPDFQQRSEWIRAVARRGFGGRVITDLELGERSNYSRDTLRVAEGVYRLQPGSIRRAVEEGGTPEPLDDDAPHPAAYPKPRSTEPGWMAAHAGVLAESPLKAIIDAACDRILDQVGTDTAGMSEPDAIDITTRLCDDLEREAEIFLEQERLRRHRRQRTEGA